MNDQRVERRKEARFSVPAVASAAPQGGSDMGKATAVNMSAGGVLLRFDHPVSLAAGDRIECNILMADEAERPLSYWGLGRIVRAEGCSVAVELDLLDSTTP